jgi:hypothetical protein
MWGVQPTVCAAGISARGGGTQLPGKRRNLHPQRRAELAALALPVTHRDAATHQRDQSGADRDLETCPPVLARRRGIGLREGIEDHLLLRVGDANTRVAYRHREFEGGAADRRDDLQQRETRVAHPPIEPGPEQDVEGEQAGRHHGAAIDQRIEGHEAGKGADACKAHQQHVAGCGDQEAEHSDALLPVGEMRAEEQPLPRGEGCRCRGGRWARAMGHGFR